MNGDPKLEASQALPAFDYAAYARLLGLEGIRVERPEDVGPAWDDALAAGRPALLDVVTDPEVPPLPPHIRADQAKGLASALRQGDPAMRDIIRHSLARQAGRVHARADRAIGRDGEPWRGAPLRNLRRGRGQQMLAAPPPPRRCPSASRCSSTTTAGRSRTSGCGPRSCCCPRSGPPERPAVASERAARTWLPALAALDGGERRLRRGHARARHRPQAGRVPRGVLQPRAPGRRSSRRARSSMTGGARAPRRRDAPGALVMAGHFRGAGHLPKQRARRPAGAARGGCRASSADDAAGSRALPRLRRARGGAALGPGDAQRRRLAGCRRRRCGSFTEPEARDPRVFCDVVLAQDAEPRVPVLAMVDERLHERRFDGYRYADMPEDDETWRRVGRGLDEAAGGAFAALDEVRSGSRSSTAFAAGELRGGVWDDLPGLACVVGGHALRARRVLRASLGVERDRLRRTALPARLHAPGGDARRARRRGGDLRASIRSGHADAGPSDGATRRVRQGRGRPRDNDSRYLLDPHRRGVPNVDRMARYADDDEVDLAIVGAGAGGATLAQRLARRGWRVVVLESGPFWDPDRDWVSDEAGVAPTLLDRAARHRRRATRSSWARTTPATASAARWCTSRATPRACTRRTSRSAARRRRRRTGRSPTRSCGRTTSASRPSCPSPGRTGRGATRTATRTRAHPISAGAERPCAGRARRGIDLRVGPVAIANGAFGNRPHCIYRGFCLQGCKVNAKASPLVTHVPDAIEHGVGDPGGRPRRPHRDRRDAVAAPACATYATGPSTSSARPRSPSRATRSRPRGYCCTRRRRGSRTASPTTTTRSGATSWSRARRR